MNANNSSYHLTAGHTRLVDTQDFLSISLIFLITEHHYDPYNQGTSGIMFDPEDVVKKEGASHETVIPHIDTLSPPTQPTDLVCSSDPVPTLPDTTASS
ncbi:hypothetical protein HAX54_038747 [Datura stramonium]|uniref:Uncharacterized protein n=1 Tax=Datura stramonium TaxID=4076 RepID=A0ABS8SIM6_DATST|nr:hypothetical protein [Datura stramonium]